MRAKDLVKDNIAYHSTLNQDVWDGDELRVDVRYKLLEIAKRFIEYLDVPDFKLLDVILRGSLTNYNYTRYSDFDLHVVTDYAVLNCDITEPFYMAKKKIWNDEHDIYIKGHEVELYVEDRDEQNASEGMYSVLDNKWYKRPEYRQPDINDHAINAKAHDLMAQIDRAISAGSVEDISRLQAKIKAMRQAGLDKAGEFSTENLAFKIIRNKGYIDRLYKTKQQKVDQELSLDEGEDVYSVKTDKGLEFKCTDKDHAVNKARSLLSYKKADKVYILQNGKAVYSWQLGSKLEPLDERKKSKKKRSKRSYPVGGYYGYYWGGTNYNDSDSDASGDAGGGDGGGESVYEDDSWPKVDGGYEHSGLGYKRDPATGKYPVYPLPRWNIYSKYSRNEKGTSMDILHYMTFLQDSYQTASMDISGDEIANTIAKMYDKNPKQELQRLNSSQELDFNSWHDVYRVLKKHHQDEMIKALRPKSLDESQARLDPAVEEFLDGLTPDDVGKDTVGDYVVHYEGFTDQCQDTEDYRNNPEAVFDEVWSDFKKREGGKKPVNYGIVGEHDYPIVYSVFRL